MRQQTTLNSSGWLTSFMRSSHMGALIALFFSITLTACGGAKERTDISEEPGPDGVTPTLTSVEIYNSFNGASDAKLGQSVSVDITASESIMKPVITIAGMSATVSGQHHAWSAEVTFEDETMADGAVAFTIAYEDISGEAGVDVTETTLAGDANFAALTYCKEGCASGGSVDPIVGDWFLAQSAAALAVGPTQGATDWWSNSELDLVSRDCLFDDIFRFNSDGTFENVQDGSTFLEPWQNDEGEEKCGAPLAPHDGSNAATYTYDEDGLTLTLDGLGAHVGLPKAINGSEISNPGDAAASIVYTIGAKSDTEMVLDINMGAGWWRFTLNREVAAGSVDPIVGDWQLAQSAAALAVGPTQGATDWWSNSELDLVSRDCLFDDIFRFNSDGTFENVQDGSTFLEPWQNDEGEEKCGAPLAPHDGSNAATYTYDEDGLTLTLDGLGAHVGLPKAINGSEISNPGDAAASIVYTIGAKSDTEMVLDINMGAGWWRFTLNREVTASSDGGAASSDSILVGDWKIAPEAGALGVGPSQGDSSWWSNGAADVDNRACFFDDIFRFNADGSFENVMGDDTWLEGWQGVGSDSCGALIAPHDGSNAATYKYIEAANTLKITGVGAHIGLAKVINEAELTNPMDAPASISYIVTALNDSEMTLDIEIAGGAYWSFKLVKI